MAAIFSLVIFNKLLKIFVEFLNLRPLQQALRAVESTQHVANYLMRWKNVIPFKLIIVKSRNCTFLLKDLPGISIDDFTGSLGEGNIL